MSTIHSNHSNWGYFDQSKNQEYSNFTDDSETESVEPDTNNTFNLHLILSKALSKTILRECDDHKKANELRILKIQSDFDVNTADAVMCCDDFCYY